MSNLVGILSAQHRAIEKRVESIRAAVQEKDAVRIYVELPPLRSAIAAHLRFEAAELYPRLAELAQTSGDGKLAVTGREFAASVTALGEAVERFLDRHPSRQIDLELFAPDWAALVEQVLGRIRAEEDRLYTAFTQASGRRLSSLGFAPTR